MRLRIVSDGTLHGTSVQTENGEEINGTVTAITWSLDANKSAAAQVTVKLFGLAVDVDLTGDTEVPA